MFTLHIEHSVRDYDAWKQMFDSDPLGRKTAGVSSFRIMRPVDDVESVRIDLDFDSRTDAEKMKVALEELWKGPGVALMRNPRALLTETVADVTL
ncbi:hypothetical protein [Cryobacterium adonitolivorans]|nr:hypothetical protein [Cryobacterium adonitolivorans]